MKPNDMKEKIKAIDWPNIALEMNQKGYAIVPKLLSDQHCKELISNYDNSNSYRKTIVMERHRFGLGEYKYFNYPLPNVVQNIRENVYPQLAKIANEWMKSLNIDTTFPDSHQEFLKLCREHNQTKSTVLILQYGAGGYNNLHQDLYGKVYFPIQAVLFLNEADEDFKGGEFVLTQQVPRAQSKAIVLKPKKGDMLIITTNFRPIRGTRGYHRVNMKHGVSEVHSGERHTLGIIFHDALS